MAAAGKYAHLELERRFLLAEVPPRIGRDTERRIHDRYIIETRLRLRRVDWTDGRPAVREVSDDIRFSGGALAAAESPPD